MNHLLARLWPRSVAGRLVFLLIAALAVAQGTLVLLLRSQQDVVVEGIIHGQALSQTVTLARLLDAYPAAESGRLAAAFGSRASCARITSEPPPARAMTKAERDLADLLGAMLHGVRAGPPQVAIEAIEHRTHPCGDAPDSAGIWQSGKGSERRGSPSFSERPRIAAVALTVPLPDGRWLTVRTAVGLPGGWTRPTFMSFLLSSIAVTLVAVIVVRTQTRSLRALANASERFGRGEAVPPLSVGGPSEVAAATRAFNAMQERLSQFMRDRLKLLAGISHDLRTPLTTLRLKAEFVEDDAVREDIVATIEELTGICEAALAFTSAEATSEATQAVDLHGLAGEVAEAFHLAGADVHVMPGPALVYACRPVALKRALRNLVENAVRYGGGARLSVAGHGTAAVQITVADDGPGLPPDRIEDAFLPFVRLEPSRSSETGGIGLGLAIARSIVKAHGGTLSLVNRPERGLSAEIRLPPAPLA
ncbi:ATP-binding protein [Xanthobacter oligotrophicus]|uniref:histidine kinase n=1 Tax=Xanthobacter oligotrophicus TaxID=2607286 RepID=A0ABW7A475_9HYPH